MNNIYNNLKNLVDTNDAFVIREFRIDGHVYEIFLYRLASRTMFETPSALLARGIMFLNGNLICRTMPKFFNMEEDLGYLDINLNEYDEAMMKMDGSLISSYIDHNGLLKLKSKGSLDSVQALAAMELIDADKDLYRLVYDMTRNGLTFNFEYTSPSNRIVVGYNESKLTILNAIDENYEYVNREYLKQLFPNHLVKPISNVRPEQVRDMVTYDGEFIEGFVFINSSNGHMIKCKTARYVELHSAKNSINNKRKLLECLLDDGGDDLRTLFKDDAIVLDYLESAENEVFDTFNSIVSYVERIIKFSKKNNMSRKDFAIERKSDRLFSLLMNGFLDKEIRYKEFLIKNRDEFFPNLINES